MTLKLINGGKDDEPSPQKKHHLAEYLWRAICPKHAVSREQIRVRMEKLRREPTTIEQVDDVMLDIRTRQDIYGWTVPHVQKGRTGEDRLYFPVLIDADDPDTMVIDDTYLVPFLKGEISSMRGIATGMEIGAANCEAFAATADLSRAEKRQFRQTAAALGAAKRMIEEALKIVSK